MPLLPLQLITYFCTRIHYYAPRTTQLPTLSLHDALPISGTATLSNGTVVHGGPMYPGVGGLPRGHWNKDAKDRKSTRLNSSHRCISYAVFCLKKKKE